MSKFRNCTRKVYAGAYQGFFHGRRKKFTDFNRHIYYTHIINIYIINIFIDLLYPYYYIHVVFKKYFSFVYTIITKQSLIFLRTVKEYLELYHL